MSTSISFVAIGLCLESVDYDGDLVLLVQFTADPLQVSPTGTNDALNPANYTVTGPDLAVVDFVTSVPGSPQYVRISLKDPLAMAGTWTLSASTNIKTVAGLNLTAPTSLSFDVTARPKVQHATSTGIKEASVPGVYVEWEPE